MVKQEWELAQDEFFRFYNRNKNTVCFRFPDTKDANSKNFGQHNHFLVALDPQPSDFIVVENGKTFFAEVKATADTKDMKSKLFKQSQLNARLKVKNAGGDYFFYIKRLETNQWYRIPHTYEKLQASWQELENFRIDLF